MKIIIVGNGESVFNKKNGKIIDSFDLVIRCNSFKINGYKEYVGSKIDIISAISSGAGCKAFNNSQDNSTIRQAKEIWFSRPKKLCDKFHKTTLTRKINNSQLLKYPSMELFNNLCKKCKEIENVEKKPSTGIVTIEMALSFFLNEDIYIIGFDNFRSNHYYNKNKKIGRSHPQKAEKQIIDKYINKGILKLL